MPGTVLRVLVAPGEAVQARQPLLVLEAMKMETPVVAPVAGRVTALHVEAGASVAAGAALVTIES
jgi:biotin carboxyl carrier protein